MSLLLGLFTASLLQSAPAPLPSQGWVWTLYEGSSATVVLAEEVPDTPHLRSTFECVQGSGQARLTHYQAPVAASATPSGNASLSAGSARQEAPVTLNGERLSLNLRLATPVFQGLVTSGRLSLSFDDQTTEFRFDRPSLPRLRRFAELCAG